MGFALAACPSVRGISPALRGVLLYDIPLEEFLFGAAFGLYWSGVREHFTWSESVAHGARN